jgi:hypothetical protein
MIDIIWILLYEQKRINKMRDDHYRQFCFTNQSYDAVIDWIKENNPAASRELGNGIYSDAEDFASNVVNDCIRTLIFGKDTGSFCSTGMCIAVRVSNNPELPGYKQVILAIVL